MVDFWDTLDPLAWMLLAKKAAAPTVSEETTSLSPDCLWLRSSTQEETEQGANARCSSSKVSYKKHLVHATDCVHPAKMDFAGRTKPEKLPLSLMTLEALWMSKPMYKDGVVLEYKSVLVTIANDIKKRNKMLHRGRKFTECAPGGRKVVLCGICLELAG